MLVEGAGVMSSMGAVPVEGAGVLSSMGAVMAEGAGGRFSMGVSLVVPCSSSLGVTSMSSSATFEQNSSYDDKFKPPAIVIGKFLSQGINLQCVACQFGQRLREVEWTLF